MSNVDPCEPSSLSSSSFSPDPLNRMSPTKAIPSPLQEYRGRRKPRLRRHKTRRRRSKPSPSPVARHRRKPVSRRKPRPPPSPKSNPSKPVPIHYSPLPWFWTPAVPHPQPPQSTSPQPVPLPNLTWYLPTPHASPPMQTVVPAPTSSGPADLCASSNWSMIWNDEFEFFDPSKWSYQLYDGFQIGLGEWGNNEWEYYTNRTENVKTGNGSLILHAQVESNSTWLYNNCLHECMDRCAALGYAPGTPAYGYCVPPCSYPRCDIVRNRSITSGRISTCGHFSIAPSQQYNTIRVESRISMDVGIGLWPAFWLLPDGVGGSCNGSGKYGRWPASGEIDVMEALPIFDNTPVYATIHYGNVSIPEQSSNHINASVSQYNVFAMEWEPSQMRFYVNGIQYASFNSSTWFSASPNAGPNSPFDQPFHILLNLAVGGNWPSAIYQSTFGKMMNIADVQQSLGTTGKSLMVDWVRVCGR